MNNQITFEFKERPTIKGFPELRWTGKRPYRSTQYFPAQMRERYGYEVDNWINKIFWGDNLQVMSHLLKEFRGSIDLIYIDPPFDSKADYKKKIEVRDVGSATNDSTFFEEKQYGDIWTNDEYLQFMYERLILIRELLSDNGSIYLHCDWHRSHYLRILMDEVFGQSNFRNCIAWCYTGPGQAQKYFPRKHDSILFYSKSDNNTFNTPRIKHKSGVHNTGQLFGGNMEENQDLKRELEEQGKKLEDWWVDIWSADRYRSELVGYPTQKPEALIERIILASSNPGDIVFDCFMGSGTTQAVAMKLGRRFIGADINLGAIHATTKRLISVAAELQPATYKSQKSVDLVNEQDDKRNTLLNRNQVQNLSDELNISSRTFFTGFEIYNVNNYDFFRNPIEARDLLIEALEIQPFPQSNLWDGELDGRMVKIMPVNRISTKADLEELKANLPYKVYERRKIENPSQAVEKITIVCMGHEPDLKASLEAELAEYKIDIQIVDILRDKTFLLLKRDSEADIVIKDGLLIIRAFYPLNLMQKLSLQKEFVSDWRALVESVMIDWNFDGVVMQPTVMDVPTKKDIVKGTYNIPESAGIIKVKITDLLSESLEMEVQ
jgi:site-specific DNA-methyltransferase (adenine-specific)